MDKLLERTEFNRAYGFTQCAHRKQKRKYTGDPYDTHCLHVALLVASYVDDMETVTAALLHDTLEDTNVTDTELEALFGHRVTTLVCEVTDVSKPEDGNRQKRKEIDRLHLANSSFYGASIKLADLIDNTSSILMHDKAFAKIYIPEKRAVLEVLGHGHPVLWKKAEETLIHAEKELGID